MFETYVRDRITDLRLKKGVSEYQMSLDLGHGKNYIHSITSGRTLPSLSELPYICEYLGVSVEGFFDQSDLLALIHIMDRIKPENKL